MWGSKRLSMELKEKTKETTTYRGQGSQLIFFLWNPLQLYMEYHLPSLAA